MKKHADKKAKSQPASFFSGNRPFYLLILVLAFLFYGNSLRNGFALDDGLVTGINPLIKKGISALPEIFTTHYASAGAEGFEYRPLVKATYAIEYQLFGTNPGLSHFINVLLYALTGMVLFKFLRKCFANQNAWLPLLASLLFIAHPVHTEVVDNLKSRDEIMALLFSLQAGIVLLRYADDGKLKNLAIGIGIFLFALLSKASCWAFVGILPLAVYYFKSNIKAALIVGVSLLVLTGIYYGSVIAMLGGIGRDFYFVENPLVDQPDFTIRLASAFYWLSHYLRLLLVPYPLAYYYGYNQMPETTFANPFAILSALLHIALLAYAIWGLKKRLPLSFTAWLYLGGIAVYSNIAVPVIGIVGERFIYIASISFCIAVAYGIIKLAKLETAEGFKVQPNNMVYGLCALLILPYGFITVNRNADWKDAITLFRHDVKVVKNSAKAHGELAMELRRQFKKLPPNNPNRKKLAAEAAEHFAASVKIYPNSEYYNYLGTIYLFEERNPSMAVGPLRLAVAKSPNPPIKYWLDLANCYQAMEPRQLDSAETYFLKVLDKDTLHIQAHYQLAKNSYLKGDTAAAKNINRRFLKLYPENPLPYRNQADFYMIEGDTANAIIWYKKEKYYQDRLVKPNTPDDE